MWVYVVAWAVALVVAVKFATPKPQNAKPPALEDLQLPIAEEGAEIPVLFGTRDLKGPNCVWYGDLRLVPVRAKGGK